MIKRSLYPVEIIIALIDLVTKALSFATAVLLLVNTRPGSGKHWGADVWLISVRAESRTPEASRLSAVPLSVFIIASLFVYVKFCIALYSSLCCVSLINAYQSVYTLPGHCHNGRRLASLRARSGISDRKEVMLWTIIRSWWLCLRS